MLYAPKIKGYIGESRVARQLGKLNGEEYKVFNDVLIRTGRGSSQIEIKLVPPGSINDNCIDIALKYAK